MAFITPPEIKLRHIYIKPEDLESHVYSDPSIVEVAEIVDVVDGNGRQHTLTDMANRYATKVEKTEDESGTEQSYQLRSKAAAAYAIQHGLFEVVNTYLFEKTNQLRSIFKKNSKYTYSKQDELYTKDLQEARKEGDDQLSMARVDSLAEAVGSSACLVQIMDGKFNYQPIIRNRIWVAFADHKIDENGDEHPINTFNIDDASTVVVQLTDPDSNSKSDYIAYFTDSDFYPDGRCVQYNAENWYDIPDAGEPDAKDNLEGEQVVNPLTISSKDYYDGKGPQIPIVLWYNDSTGFGKTLMPITPDYYKQCKELNLDNSRVMLSGLKSARGIITYIREMTGTSIIPEVFDEGAVVIDGNQLDVKSVPGANSTAASQLIQEALVNTGSSRGIPSHYINVGDQVNFASGTALMMANLPLESALETRVTYNRGNMRRKFDIETSLTSLNNGTAIGVDVTEVWIPDTKIYVKTAEELRSEIEFALKNKIMDMETAFQMLYNIESKEEAANKLKALKTLPAAEKTGIFGNR